MKRQKHRNVFWFQENEHEEKMLVVPERGGRNHHSRARQKLLDTEVGGPTKIRGSGGPDNLPPPLTRPKIYQ